MVKEYDPTAPVPDWELEPMTQEGDTADATTLSAEEVMADVARAAGGSERPVEESAEIMALTAELKGETAPSNVGEKSSEGELDGPFDDAPAKSPERPVSQMSKEEIDAEINEMFADEPRVPEKAPASVATVSRGEYSQDEIGELNNFLGGNALEGRPEGLLAERKLKDEESQKKYKWGAVGAGATTLLSGIGASALGYTALGAGLAIGAAPVLAGGAAIWGIKKGWDAWRRRGAAKKLAAIHNDQTILDS